MGKKSIDSAIVNMIYLSACAVHGVRPHVSRLSDCDFQALYRLCRFHSMTSIVYTALEKAFDGELPKSDVFTDWCEERYKSIRNGLIMDAERRELFCWCKQQNIWYMPLKGILIREVYPASEMRQMADNDILFDSAYREQVHDWFVSREYDVKVYNGGGHDVYCKNPALNFEMHTALFSAARTPQLVSYYKNIRYKLIADEDNAYALRFSDEDFFIYMMAHSYKHHTNGGNGLRSLLDIYLYQEKYSGILDEQYIDMELEKLGIADFSRKTRALSIKLFANAEMPNMDAFTEDESEMLYYFLSSGTYGTSEHQIINDFTKSCRDEKRITIISKIKYLYRRLFPSREYMLKWCSYFAPFFIKHQSVFWLSPFVRLCRFKTLKDSDALKEFSTVLKTPTNALKNTPENPPQKSENKKN